MDRTPADADRRAAPPGTQLLPPPRPCPLCGHPAGEIVAVTPPHLAPDRGERFRWVRCGECGLVRLANFPDDVELEAYYGPGYLPHRGPEAWGRWAPRVRRALEARDRRRVRRARRAVEVDGPRPDPTGVRILDVGCGRPTFLRALKEATGWRATGIDTSDAGWAGDDPEAWNGLDLRVGRVEEADLDAGSFDLVTLWHVLEHVRFPGPFLGALHRLVRPGGHLLVEVPDHASLTRRLQGASWIGYDAPRHAAAYEPDTLHRMLTETGWEVVELRRLGSLDPWVLWWLGRQVARGRTLEGSLERDFLPFLAGKLLTAPLAALQRWVPLGAMTAVARRPAGT